MFPWDRCTPSACSTLPTEPVGLELTAGRLELGGGDMSNHTGPQLNMFSVMQAYDLDCLTGFDRMAAAAVVVVVVVVVVAEHNSSDNMLPKHCSLYDKTQ